MTTKTATTKTNKGFDRPKLFARFRGPGGGRFYASPVSTIGDLTLLTNRWTQVPEAFSESGTFARDAQAGVIETLEASALPKDDNTDLDPALAEQLAPEERELARIVAGEPGDLKPVYESAIAVASVHLDSKGKRRVNNSIVTIAYVRDRHLPFLVALADMEKRGQNRKAVLALIEREIKYIDSLPSVD